MRHNIYVKILLLLPALLLLLPAGLSAQGGPPARILEDFGPGRPQTVMKSLGMPFPDDTAGIHYFVNPSDPVLLRFRLWGKGKDRSVQWVQLTYRNSIPWEELNGAHQMIARESLSRISTAGGLSLGDFQEDAAKIYGPPTGKRPGPGGGTTLEYSIGEGRILQVFVVRGKVHSITQTVR